MFQEDKKSIQRFFIAVGILAGIGILALIYAVCMGLHSLAQHWGG